MTVEVHGQRLAVDLRAKYAVLASCPIEVAVLEVGRAVTQPDGHTVFEPINLAWLPEDVEGLIRRVVAADAERFVVAEVESD